jgi:lipoprotein-anchoring transpeptidase ErfK/SrfK
MADDRFLEIRSYTLHPGTRDRFDTLFRTGVVPLMQAQGMTVIDFGPSVDAADGYYLMRAYPSLERRTQVLGVFDSSKEWLETYDKEVLSLIDTSTTVVLPASPEALHQLASRQAHASPSASPPLATLAAPVAGPPPAPPRNARFASQQDLTDVLAGKKTLGSGIRGPGVSAVQQALVDMGFSLNGGADGSFGPQSARAVRNFQVHAQSAFPQVRPTGTVDAATLRALDALAPAPGQHGQAQHLPGPAYQGTLVRVVVVKNEHRTFLFDAAGKLQAIYGNAVGKGSTPTDPGLKKVTGKLGEADSHALGQKLWGGFVFGPRIVDLSWDNGTRSGEELHGTNAPIQLGEDVSHGCVRHANPDILALYDALRVGDRVAIVESVSDPHLGTPTTPPPSSPSGPVVASR